MFSRIGIEEGLLAAIFVKDSPPNSPLRGIAFFIMFDYKYSNFGLAMSANWLFRYKSPSAMLEMEE